MHETLFLFFSTMLTRAHHEGEQRMRRTLSPPIDDYSKNIILKSPNSTLGNTIEDR